MKAILFLIPFLSMLSEVPQTIERNQDIENTDLCDISILDFNLTNMTGYTIKDIFIAPTTQREWGDDVLGRDMLYHEETVEIEFHPGETAKKWDIYVTWDGYESSEDVYWIGFDLSKISAITLYYDSDTGKTWAEYE
jgi:hypothetical protein